MTADPSWYPSPPMALEYEWETWRELALVWMARQTSEWTADDLRAAMPECRSHWPGAAVNTASRRGLIVDAGRMIRSISPTRKKSRLPVWRTKNPPKENPMENFDQTPLSPSELSTLTVEKASRRYTEDGDTSPVSGDVIARGKAEWVR